MSQSIQIEGMTFDILLSRDVIAKRTQELGAEIARDFQDRNPIFIGVLNGSFVFMSDLVRSCHIPCEMDFIKISSYGDEMTTSGEVKMLKDYDSLVHNRHLILVEDIVDSGLSIEFLRHKFDLQNIASVSVVSLLFKEANAKLQKPIEYVGFNIPDRFVIGYGLDYKQQFRNLDAIYALRDEGEE